MEDSRPEHAPYALMSWSSPDERLSRQWAQQAADMQFGGATPTCDPDWLNDRVRKLAMQVRKLKKDMKAERASRRAALNLQHEEGYKDALLEFAPAMLELDEKIARIALGIIDKVEAGESTGDERATLRLLLPQVEKQRERLYGRTTQRVDSTMVSASVDVAELARSSRSGRVIDPGPDPDVIEAEVEAEGDK